MTPRQLEVLRYVEEYRGREGCAPTLQEIADHLKVAKVTVHSHLRNLEKSKLIRRGYYRRRGIELVPPARNLPLIGKISIGKPIGQIPTPTGVDLTAPFSRRGKFFALRVEGDSLLDAQIRDGDLLLCERRREAREDETVVALLEGAARVGPAAGLPAAASIQGVVVGLYRRM